MASGILPFTGGTAVADQSKSGTQSQSGSTMENKSGNAGEGSMKQGHESSGKMKQEPYGRTGEPKAGGEAILGGSGQIPDSSKVPRIPHDKGSVGSGSGDTQTSQAKPGLPAVRVLLEGRNPLVTREAADTRLVVITSCRG